MNRRNFIRSAAYAIGGASVVPFVAVSSTQESEPEAIIVGRIHRNVYENGEWSFSARSKDMDDSERWTQAVAKWDNVELVTWKANGEDAVFRIVGKGEPPPALGFES